MAAGNKVAENGKVEVEELRTALERERAEKEAYRRAAMLAEANELVLHRKLAGYVDEEMARLRARNEALEKELARSQDPLEEHGDGAR